MRLFLCLAVVVVGAPALAQTRNAADIYRAACAACHGIDGAGAPITQVGFDTPLPDFTECSFQTREPDADWFAITHQGGPVRAFDRRMPAFGEALTEPQIELAVSHIRTFCDERAWPRGELNLPRALVTEKAYPEDEAVWTMSASRGAAASLVQTLIYEKRFGPRSQVEFVVPLALRENGAGWQRGLGDVAIAVKHALAHSIDTGSILSVAGEVILPTGKETIGLGKGVTIFEPFVAYGQILPHAFFLQMQAGGEFPTDRAIAEREAFVRAAGGFTLEPKRFGRAWSPIVELAGVRELVAGEPMQWDIVPQMQVTLSRRQHIMLNAGIRQPLNERAGRSRTFLAYVLWDWYDGGLFDGWR
jgi:hypothetical protein